MFNYHIVCLALSRRIKQHQDLLQQETDNKETTEEVLPDFAEGLKRMLTSLYGHTSNNVLSSTMATKLLIDGERFKFSHDFKSIPLKHLIEWLSGEEHLEFKLRKVRIDDNKYEHVQDMFINNMIYRPIELEDLGCYDMISRYELKRKKKEKINSESNLIESKKTFNLVQEHPSHKCMVMSERKHIVIPCIDSLNLLPNIADLYQKEATNDPNIIELREEYAKIILLLFYPYCTQDDLEINGSYWEKYRFVIDNNKLSPKSLEVCQNIQDVCHNCSNLKQAKDELIKTTVFTPHEDDNKSKTQKNENLTSIEEFADMFRQLEDYGIRDVNPKQRSLKIISQRHKIVKQDIPSIRATIPDITDIPDGIKTTTMASSGSIESNNNDIQTNPLPLDFNTKMSFPMIIDILNDTILSALPNNYICTKNDTSTDPYAQSKDLSFKAIIAKYKLDFKQAIVFEIMHVHLSLVLEILKNF